MQQALRIGMVGPPNTPLLEILNNRY